MAGGTFLLQGVINLIFPEITPLMIWLIYAFIVTVFLGVDHPRARVEEPLDFPRKVLGWIAIVIFILCFSPNPIRMI